MHIIFVMSEWLMENVWEADRDIATEGHYSVKQFALFIKVKSIQ